MVHWFGGALRHLMAVDELSTVDIIREPPSISFPCFLLSFFLGLLNLNHFFFNLLQNLVWLTGFFVLISARLLG
jgi:hypothetical protein